MRAEQGLVAGSSRGGAVGTLAEGLPDRGDPQVRSGVGSLTFRRWRGLGESPAPGVLAGTEPRGQGPLPGSHSCTPAPAPRQTLPSVVVAMVTGGLTGSQVLEGGALRARGKRGGYRGGQRDGRREGEAAGGGRGKGPERGHARGSGGGKGEPRGLRSGRGAGAAPSPAVRRRRLPAGLATRLRHLPLLGDAVNIRRAETERAPRAGRPLCHFCAPATDSQCANTLKHKHGSSISASPPELCPTWLSFCKATPCQSASSGHRRYLQGTPRGTRGLGHRSAGGCKQWGGGRQGPRASCTFGAPKTPAWCPPVPL